MIIYPAIDLRQGKCVRLIQGDYTQEICYNKNPVLLLKTWMEVGAKWIHIVDLDGAACPRERQTILLEKLLGNKCVSIQSGGGIRTKEQIKLRLDQGAERVVVGSMAVIQPELVATWLQFFGKNRITIAFDVKVKNDLNPLVSTNGWVRQSQSSLFDLLAYYQQFKLSHVLCTDITRDGMLSGPNFELYHLIQARFPDLALQASGGIRSIDDLRLLRQQGLNGAIVGRALYEKQFTLEEAISC